MLLRMGVLAAALLAAGCHDGAADRAPANAAASKATPAKPQAANRAVLDFEGVIFNSPAGKTQEFNFGVSRTEIEAVAARMFGEADDRSTNGECGAGPMEFTRYGPLTLNYQNGKLVGWFAKEGPQVVTTDGIKPGSFVRDLKVTRSVRMIADSTLEGEFDYLAADGHPIGGFAKGDGRDAKIDSLYAGVNCFFR